MLKLSPGNRIGLIIMIKFICHYSLYIRVSNKTTCKIKISNKICIQQCKKNRVKFCRCRVNAPKMVKYLSSQVPRENHGKGMHRK